jgi:hypothetical protein
VSASGLESQGVEVSGIPTADYINYVYLTNWTYRLNTSDATNYDYAKITVIPGDSHHAVFELSKTVDNNNNNNYLYLTKSLGTLENGKIYKLTYDEKVFGRSTNSDSPQFKFNNGQPSLNGVDFNTAVNAYITNAMSTTEGVWTNRTIYVKGNGNVSSIDGILNRHVDKLYLDNFELYEVDGDTLEIVNGAQNLLSESNGDFEKDYVKPAEVSYLSIAARDSANYIAVKTTMPDIAVYRSAGGAAPVKLEPGEPVLTNAQYNLKVYADTGLTNGTEYTYTVKNVSAFGVESDGVTKSGVPLAAYNGWITVDNWAYRHLNANYGTEEIVNGIGIDGSAALKVTNMANSNAGNTYLTVQNATALQLASGTVYKLSYWRKNGFHNIGAVNGNGVDSMAVAFSNAQISDDGGVTFKETGKDGWTADAPDDGNWHEYTLYVKGTGANSKLELRIYRHFEELLFDNFSLYEVDSDLNLIANAANLLADSNCGFEAGFIGDRVDVSLKYYPAYSDGEYFGEVLTYYEISAMSDLSMYDTDTFYAEAAIKNITFSQGKPFVFVLAIYKDGALYDLRKIEATAAQAGVLSEGEKYGIAYKLPDLSTGVYSAKMFVWGDGLEIMYPLTTAKELTES